CGGCTPPCRAPRSRSLILATLFDASTADIGWSLAIYNAGGFVASLVLPAWADRRRTYLPILLAAGVLTIALAAALAAVSTLPAATVALVVLEIGRAHV